MLFAFYGFVNMLLHAFLLRVYLQYVYMQTFIFGINVVAIIMVIIGHIDSSTKTKQNTFLMFQFLVVDTAMDIVMDTVMATVIRVVKNTVDLMQKATAMDMDVVIAVVTVMVLAMVTVMALVIWTVTMDLTQSHLLHGWSSWEMGFTIFVMA